MHLIHSKTLVLKNFFDERVPAYAILSHTWGDEELSYQQFNDDRSQKHPGWKKVWDSCRLAQMHGIDWVWIDTCCIDKTSSAELSEAINSMFKWYQMATVCFAFISDFNSAENELSTLSNCRWFTRGWTLQELVAPHSVEFYDCNQRFIGTKTSLEESLSNITGIETRYLRSPELVQQACIAERMFWASKRITTRAEDVAYCLIGLFNVNMPLLYGEGVKSFTRLQQQIIAQSNDETIFAWTASTPDHNRGMLA